MNRYSLLTNEQVFGEKKIDMITALGAKCAATDYAIMTGCEISDEIHLEEDSSLQGRTGRYFLCSPGGYGDVCVVSPEGDRRMAYANASGGVRPVLPCDAPEEICERVTKDISGFAIAEHGAFPQYAADRDIARELESECSAGRLRRTGKTFHGGHEEYIHKGRKYIRADYVSGTPRQLSDGRRHKTGDAVWIEVSPVRWLWDERAGLLVSRVILAGGIGFCNETYYDGVFENTGIWRYLNTSLCEDLKPSRVRELTEKEQEAYEAQLRQAEKWRNPYGLTFGQVSEEDIIRGATESDVAVFLHGP